MARKKRRLPIKKPPKKGGKNENTNQVHTWRPHCDLCRANHSAHLVVK